MTQATLEHNDQGPAPTLARRVLAYAVHALTASGVAFAFLATAEVASPACDPRWVYGWLILAVIVDAIDGPFARALHVKRLAAAVDGRTIDDLVDYLTYTFVPLVLVWRMGWVPEPGGVFVVPAMIASLFGFANVKAKEEAAGFFRGFPSYWNIVAFYVGLLAPRVGPWPNAVLILALAVLTVLPVRFVYPNLAPRPWRWPVLAGSGVWLLILLALLPKYDRSPAWLVWLSLVFPAFYIVLSVHLDVVDRRRQRRATAGV